MTRDQKAEVVKALTEKINAANFFYLTDSSGLTVEEVNNLRGVCFEAGVELKVTKNTMVRKALEAADGEYEELYDILKGPTSLMFSDIPNVPAKAIKKFRGKDGEKPMLKAAYIDTAVFIGEGELDNLANIKSKEELVGEIIGLLQSPAKNVVSALKSSGGTIAGLLKTLSEREA